MLSFVDICLQAQEALLPDTGKELVFSQTQIVWSKMIAKYFREGNNEISLELYAAIFREIKKTQVSNTPKFHRNYSYLNSHPPKSGVKIRTT